MVKIAFIGLAALLVISLSCGFPGPVYRDSQVITTSVGGKFTLGLHVSKRLGPSWKVSYDADMIELIVNDEYIDDNPKNPGISGTQYFRFRALQTSTTQIETVLKLGANGPIRDAKTFTVEIR